MLGYDESFLLYCLYNNSRIFINDIMPFIKLIRPIIDSPFLSFIRCYSLEYLLRMNIANLIRVLTSVTWLCGYPPIPEESHTFHKQNQINYVYAFELSMIAFQIILFPARSKDLFKTLFHIPIRPGRSSIFFSYTYKY